MDARIDALAAAVGERLSRAGWTAVTAESCTAGLVAGAITSVAGSSAWFDRGFVVYSDAAKRELLGVSEATLARHGAVSEQTAREMARGALSRSPAAIAVAVTGIAGPGGATPGKPVGLVCFAWVTRGGAQDSATRRFEGDRRAVRAASVAFALEGLLARVARSAEGGTTGV